MSENIEINFWKGQLFEIVTLGGEFYYAQLMEYEPNLLVQMPVNRKNNPLSITNDMPVTVYFHNDLKELYSFDSKIYQLENRKILINKPANDKIEKAQRRRFFRVQVAVEMHLSLPSTNKSNHVDKLTTFTHDISGGGASFLFTDKIIEEQNEVKGILYLRTNNDEKQVEFKAKIVNVIKQQNNSYRISLQFIDMSESTRLEIIQFCMYKQIELRNKVRGSSLD